MSALTLPTTDLTCWKLTSTQEIKLSTSRGTSVQKVIDGQVNHGFGNPTHKREQQQNMTVTRRTAKPNLSNYWGFSRLWSNTSLQLCHEEAVLPLCLPAPRTRAQMDSQWDKSGKHLSWKTMLLDEFALERTVPRPSLTLEHHMSWCQQRWSGNKDCAPSF